MLDFCPIIVYTIIAGIGGAHEKAKLDKSSKISHGKK